MTAPTQVVRGSGSGISRGPRGLQGPPGSGGSAAHAASHQNGGADELSVAGLSGLLADAQTPLTHMHTVAQVTALPAAMLALVSVRL